MLLISLEIIAQEFVFTIVAFLIAGSLAAENSPVTDLIVVWSDSGVITPETVWTILHFPTLIWYLKIPHAFVYDNQLATDVNAVYISLDSFDGTTGSFFGINACYS